MGWSVSLQTPVQDQYFLRVVGASNAALMGVNILYQSRPARCIVSHALPNTERRYLDRQPRCTRVADLPACPELILGSTPPATVPGLIDALGRCGSFTATSFSSRRAHRHIVLVDAPGTSRTHLDTTISVRAAERHHRRLGFFSTVEPVNALGLEKASASQATWPRDSCMPTWLFGSLDWKREVCAT